MSVRRRTVAILSDQTLFREGLLEILRSNRFERVSEFATTRALLEAARAHPPDIVIIDIDHEREDVVVILRALRRALLDSQIVVIGSPLRQAAGVGVSGRRRRRDADRRFAIAGERHRARVAHAAADARGIAPATALGRNHAASA